MLGSGVNHPPVGGGFGGCSDKSVQATNDDATVSKLSCVQHGYFSDNFVKFFVRRHTRRSPVIHRGYFARYAGLRVLLDQFLSMGIPQNPEGEGEGGGNPEEASSSEGGGDKEGAKRVLQCYSNLQIVSLGAGFDTLFFQLQEEGRIPGKFLEVDFPEVTSKKAGIINSKPQLCSLLTGFKLAPEKCGFVSDHYSAVCADLRKTDELQAMLTSAGADFSLPTLILAECVLIYMDPMSSRNLINWAGKTFSNAAFVVYEQIRPDDSFGQQMIQNLEARGCPLLGLRATPSLESKEERFIQNGFPKGGKEGRRCEGYKEAEAVDMDVVYSQCIDHTLKHRIEGLEIFDEFEEWHMMQEHYCIAYGIRKENQALFQNFGFNIRRRNEEDAKREKL